MTEKSFAVFNRNMLIEFDSRMRSRVCRINGRDTAAIGEFSHSHHISADGMPITDFEVKYRESRKISDDLGPGERFVITGVNRSLEKKLFASVYEDFPSTVFFKAVYTNMGNGDIMLDSWTNNEYFISSGRGTKGSELFWSYQGGSYEERPDWVIPLKEGFRQENFMGMNASDYGGGIPVSDIWTGEAGLAVGHAERIPRLVSLPVCMPDDRTASAAVACDLGMKLKPGQSFATYDTFVTVHKGDYFNALLEYRRIMEKRGIAPCKAPGTAYEPTWCGWGYGREFTLQQIYDTVPKVRKLGIPWVCLDDGWQSEEGDCSPDTRKFPEGDPGMKGFVDSLHSQGFKAQLWWIPLAADPRSEITEAHPEFLILDRDGKEQFISWWDSYYLCPACEGVREHTRQALKRIFVEWGFDGLKIDGQHLNAAPPCFNSQHRHSRPEEAFEAVPEFFRLVYETAMELKPDAMIMFCPCGTSYSYHTMPYFNAAVASDPSGSWQVRLKGKAVKALMGADAAYHGDHVELSDNSDDFASTIGIGGVIDTKFTLPVKTAVCDASELEGEYGLDDFKERNWKHWIDIYSQKLLSSGEYLGGLYCIGFDIPEAHAVKKGGKMYYAFFADGWKGRVELRGLEELKYSVCDYVNGVTFGEVEGPSAEITIFIQKFILLEATPKL